MNLNLKKSLKKLYKSSWFITLFATTLGVLLAFYLNNLGERLKIEDRKQISIKNLNKELSNNKAELLNSEDNDRLMDFLNSIRKIDRKISNELITSTSAMNSLLQQYSDFITIVDSSSIDTNSYKYEVVYKFELSLDDPQNIAWETAKMSNVTNELDYDCLQVLVKIYSLQEIYTQEQQKVLNHFVNTEHTKLLSTMQIIKQLKDQLLNAIIDGQGKIKNCE